MKRIFKLAIGYILILTSLLIIDGGRPSYLTGSQILNISNNDVNDPESASHYNYSIADDIEKWIMTDYCEIILTPIISWRFSDFSSKKIKDYSLSIWQPPKEC